MHVTQLTDIKGRERYIALEHLHIQPASVCDITLSNLHKSAESCAAPPAIMEQITDEGVQDDIRTCAIRRCHNRGKERRVPGIEDVLRPHSKVVDEVIFLLLGANSGVDGGALEVSDLDRCDSDTAST